MDTLISMRIATYANSRFGGGGQRYNWYVRRAWILGCRSVLAYGSWRLKDDRLRRVGYKQSMLDMRTEGYKRNEAFALCTGRLF